MRFSDAEWADVQDGATLNHRSIHAEIMARILAPTSRSHRLYGHYEQTIPLEVLVLRTEPEDFGPTLQLWRARRDVSRSWLAEMLQIESRVLAEWETAHRQIPDHLRDGLTERLAWLDYQYPDLQYRAQTSPDFQTTDSEFAKDKAELDAMDIETDIEWMNPGGWDGAHF